MEFAFQILGKLTFFADYRPLTVDFSWQSSQRFLVLWRLKLIFFAFFVV